MSKSIEITHDWLFALPLYSAKILKKKELKGLIESSKKWQKEDSLGSPRTNRGKNWHSDVSAFNRPEFQPLADKILNFAQRIVQKTEENRGNSPHSGKTLGVHLAEMWVNLSEDAGYHKAHNHGSGYADWSGVVYLKTPKNSGDLVFTQESVSAGLQMHEVTPEAGKIWLFPSGLTHLVEPNLSGESRLSVSFNIKVQEIPAAKDRRPSFVCIPELLNADEITLVHAQLANSSWHQGAVGDGKGAGTKDKEVRNNDVFFVDVNDKSWRWLAEKMVKAAAAVNEANYKFDLSGGPESMQFCRYKIGQKYERHIDASMDKNSPTYNRVLSCALTLRTAEKGGGTHFPDAQEQPPFQRPGDAVFFPADELHQALPVEEGIRQTLVVWFRRGQSEDQDQD